MKLDLNPEHRAIVLDILGTHLPPEAHAWVFGSRAAGCARRYSDLDLAIDAGRPLTIDERASLFEAFDECDPPFKVDLLDWQQASETFQRTVMADRILLA